jgi:hypothetical protein
LDCCNQSKNRHATKNFKEAGNPIIQNFQPGEVWKYCLLAVSILNKQLTASGVESAERLASFKEPLFRNLISKNISLFTDFIFN